MVFAVVCAARRLTAGSTLKTIRPSIQNRISPRRDSRATAAPTSRFRGAAAAAEEDESSASLASLASLASSASAPASSVTPSASASPLPIVSVHSALASGPVDYVRGWAWQQALLSRRITAQRLRRDGDGPRDDDDSKDEDRLLLFEHRPVYTLGRGADENFLTFLSAEDDGGSEGRARLSRKARGEGSARLSADKSTMAGAGAGEGARMSAGQVVDMLTGE